MKERAKEPKVEARLSKNRAEGEKDVLARIAEMPELERAMVEWLHTSIKASAPALSPKTWYGMPVYANKDGEVVSFFQSAHLTLRRPQGRYFIPIARGLWRTPSGYQRVF